MGLDLGLDLRKCRQERLFQLASVLARRRGVESSFYFLRTLFAHASAMLRHRILRHESV